jgi:hypothetical protein
MPHHSLFLICSQEKLLKRLLSRVLSRSRALFSDGLGHILTSFAFTFVPSPLPVANLTTYNF